VELGPSFWQGTALHEESDYLYGIEIRYARCTHCNSTDYYVVRQLRHDAWAMISRRMVDYDEAQRVARIAEEATRVFIAAFKNPVSNETAP
jgi:hypothetical protein